MAALALATLMFVGCSQAAPQAVDFPAKGKPITLIIPWAAGAASDAIVRVLGTGMQAALGVPVQFQNNGAASSQAGLTELSTAKPDGYTMAMFLAPAGQASYMDPRRKATYTRQSFEPVASFAQNPYFFVTRADGPYKSMQDLVNGIKTNRQNARIAVPGLMSGGHIMAAWFAKEAGVAPLIVDMGDATKSIAGLLGKQIEVASVGVSAASAQLASGELRLIGVADKQRSKLYPEVPALQELGYKIFVLAQYGLVVPAGTPKAIVDVLDSAAKKALESEDVKRGFAGLKTDIIYLNAVQYAASWDETDAAYKPLFAELTR